MNAMTKMPTTTADVGLLPRGSRMNVTAMTAPRTTQKREASQLNFLRFARSSVRGKSIRRLRTILSYVYKLASLGRWL